MPHADRPIRRSLGLLAVLGLAAMPLACGLDTNGSLPTETGGAAGSGGTAGAGGMGGAGAAGGMGGTGGSEACTPGEMRACYSGPTGTDGTGDCKAGTQICADDGSEFGPCEDEVVPAAAEDCALPGDEDCNGEAQDAAICICAPLQAVACTTGMPGICADGMGTCSADGRMIEMCMQSNKPAFDDCATAEDEDCDGTAITMCTGAPVGSSSPPQKTSDPMDDAVYDVAFAPDGGYVVAGVIDTQLGGDLFGVSGAGTVYVAKVGADGVLQWERKFPHNALIVARGVTVSPAGNVTVAGEFSGTINFGGGGLTTPSQGGDIFLVTLDPTGAHAWSKRFGATNVQSGQDVDVDGSGNLYVTGFVINDSVSLGGDAVDPDGEDLFVASYDSGGNHRWSRIFANGGDQRGRRVAVTKDGNVAVLGETGGAVNLGGSNLPGGGNRDFTVAMYEGGTGNHIWSKLFGSGGDQFHGNIAAAPNGDVLVTGRFTGSLDFGGGAMSAVGGQDMYLAELAAADGGHVRSKRFGTTGNTRGAGIAADGAGNVVVTGHFDGSVDFGSGTLTTGNANDVFVVKFSAGNWSPLWTKQFGSASTQTAWGVAVGPKGDVAVGGSFEQEIAFGAPLGTIMSSGGADLFSVLLSP